jgi:hypothetical protein
MRYRVVAGFVSAETQVDGASRAVIDIPRGAVLPDDVPVEQAERFLARGHIEPLNEEEPEPEVVDNPDAIDLDELDKEQLLAIAKDLKIQVDGRWNAEKLAAAIRENQ